MSKSADRYSETSTAGISKKDYEKALYELQVELVQLQNHLIANDLRVLVLFEGRDAAGKDGTSKGRSEQDRCGRPGRRQPISPLCRRFDQRVPLMYTCPFPKSHWS